MNKSARETAHAWVHADAKGRKALTAEIEARASVSKRARWAHMATAAKAGDELRMVAYASLGEAKREAWGSVKARDAKPKAAPKAKPKAAAKRTRKPAAKPQAGLDVNTLARSLAGMDDAKLAAFFNAVMAARK